MGLAFVDLRKAFDANLLERVYAEVLRPSFAPEELDALEVLLESLTAEDADPLGLAVAAFEGERPVGVIVGDYFTGPGVLLIGYLAVRADRRGTGLGSRLLGLAGEWHRTLGAALTLAELHDPRSYVSQADRAADRLQWYGRAGARVLNLPFVQPSLGPGRPRVPNMLLIGLHVDAVALVAESATPSVAATRVSEFIHDYYVASEGTVPGAGDPDYAAMQAALDRPVALLAPGRLDRMSA